LFFLFFLFILVAAATTVEADSSLLPKSETSATELDSMNSGLANPDSGNALLIPLDETLGQKALDEVLKNPGQGSNFGTAALPAPARLPAFASEFQFNRSGLAYGTAFGTIGSAPFYGPRSGPLGGFDRQIDFLETSRSGQFLNDRLEIKNDLRLERQTLNAFEAGKSNLPGFSALESELAATFHPSANLSLGSSFSLRRPPVFGKAAPNYLSQNDWLDLDGLYPADRAMGRVGLGYRNYLGTEFYLSGYAGTMSRVNPGAMLAGRLGQVRDQADVRGLGVSVRQDLLGGRLNFLMSAALNRYDLSTRGLKASELKSRPNLSAYLAMNYINPELFNAGITYSYGSDGFFITDAAFNPGFGGSRLNAQFWRDFSLTPALSLSTRLYGSVVLNRPPEISHLINNKPNLLDSYVEGRVTMNYAF
jgi:hypothetical protein